MACATVTLCNLLSYEIRRVKHTELGSFNSIQEAVLSYFPELTVDDKVKIYVLDFGRNSFVDSMNNPARIDLKSLRSHSDIKHDSKVIIFNLFLIGQSVLNHDSFTKRTVGNSMVASFMKERHEALQLFALFTAKISLPDICPELSHVVTSCLDNKYIGSNLSGFLSSDSASQYCCFKDIGKQLVEFEQWNDEFQERNIDSLINICNTLTSKTCEVLNSKIEQHNYKPDWADVLKPEESITIQLSNQSSPSVINIHSNVFDYIALTSQKNRDLGLDLTKIATNGPVRPLGEGGFGSTFAYTPYGLDPQQSFVIKRTKATIRNAKRPDDSKPGWFRECHHTQQLNHENIIKYFGKPILYGDVYYCIMEYGGRSLEDIYNDSGRHMDTKEIVRASLQVSSALDYLHTRNPIVIHRDLRTSNVTCNDNGVCKLIDFGLSSEKKIEETSKIVSDREWGHHLWKSPEFCWHIVYQQSNRGAAAGNKDEHLPEPGRKSDIWMFGVFVLELFAFPKRPAYFNHYRNSGNYFMVELANNRITMDEPITKCLERFDDNDIEIRSKFETLLKKSLEYDEKCRADSRTIFELCQQFGDIFI